MDDESRAKAVLLTSQAGGKYNLRRWAAVRVCGVLCVQSACSLACAANGR